MANPKLYAVGRLNHDLNARKMALYIATAVVHSTIIFFFIAGVFGGGTLTNATGQTDGLYIMGTTLNCCLELTVNLKIVLLSKTLTWYNVVIIIASAGSWFIFVQFYSELFSISGGHFLGIAEQLYSRAVFWLLVVLVPFAAVLPDFVVGYLQFNYFPLPWDVARKQEANNNRRSANEAEQRRRRRRPNLTLQTEAGGGGVEDLLHLSEGNVATRWQAAEVTVGGGLGSSSVAIDGGGGPARAASTAGEVGRKSGYAYTTATTDNAHEFASLPDSPSSHSPTGGTVSPLVRARNKMWVVARLGGFRNTSSRSRKYSLGGSGTDEETKVFLERRRGSTGSVWDGSSQELGTPTTAETTMLAGAGAGSRGMIYVDQSLEVATTTSDSSGEPDQSLETGGGGGGGSAQYAQLPRNSSVGEEGDKLV